MHAEASDGPFGTDVSTVTDVTVQGAQGVRVESVPIHSAVSSPSLLLPLSDTQYLIVSNYVGGTSVPDALTQEIQSIFASIVIGL